MDIILTIITVLLYLSAGLLLLRRLARGAEAGADSRHLPLLFALGAVVLHAFLLYSGIRTDVGLNLSFFNMSSVIAWLIAVLVLASALGQPVENLGIGIFPLSAMTLLLQSFATQTPTLVSTSSVGLDAHILLSVFSYGMLSIAAAQALLLAIQDNHLRNRHPGGFIRALPPLETMESLLFQMIGVGYALLSLSLLSGATFVEDLYAQHLIHKTVLSIVAWAVFGALLWGRWRFGWRGRTAIRWTLGGFVTLMLAYFGSKMVLELILR